MTFKKLSVFSMDEGAAELVRELHNVEVVTHRCGLATSAMEAGEGGARASIEMLDKHVTQIRNFDMRIEGILRGEDDPKDKVRQGAWVITNGE